MTTQGNNSKLSIGKTSTLGCNVNCALCSIYVKFRFLYDAFFSVFRWVPCLIDSFPLFLSRADWSEGGEGVIFDLVSNGFTTK